MNPDRLREFATRYTAAWCSKDASSVAEFFEDGGALKINNGSRSVGRAAITATAQGFMTSFPDLLVVMDAITAIDDEHATYRWTLSGTNSGPGGSGNTVRISGYEEWVIGPERLIAESKGHFDEAYYQRQLEVGTGGT
jgi:hypothetical protein